MIVTVDVANGPPEGFHLVGERLEREGGCHGREALQVVVVHHHDEVVEPVVAREHRGLPVASLVPFPIAGEDVRAPVGTAHLRGKSLPSS